MKEVSLKRMLSRKRLAPEVRAALSVLGGDVCVADDQDRVVLGAMRSRPKRHPVTLDGARIGWVSGDDDRAAHLAALLTHMAAQEARKRAVCAEALEKYKELSLLYSISGKIGALLDSRQIARLVVDELGRVFEHDRACLMVRQGDMLVELAATGDDPELGATMGLGQGIAGSVLESGNPEVVDDYSLDSRCRLDRVGSLPGSLLCVPLKTKDHVLGVVSVSSRKTGQYTSKDLKLLVSLASQAATAMEAANLFERLSRAKDSAEAGERAKTTFLTRISHEVRTPLNSIMGMSDLLLENGLDGKSETMVEAIHGSGKQLFGIFKNILDVVTLHSGDLSLAEAPVDPMAIIKNVAEHYRGQVMAKGLELKVRRGEDLPGLVVADGPKLAKALSCLVDNAVKFTERGAVVLGVDRHEYRDGGSGLAFQVTDTGPGIRKGEQDGIFEIFTQLKSSDGVSSGSGMGLALSYKMARLMGGSIEVSSEPGQGSRFTFHAPLARVRLQDQEEEPKGGEPRNLSILYAEDSANNRMLVEFYLKNSGHDLALARDGNQALDMVRGGSFDMVLMDLEMPVMDGYEATRAIRRWEQETGREPMPIVALTAHALDEDREASLAAGCSDYLTKPIKKAVLLDNIGKISMTI